MGLHSITEMNYMSDKLLEQRKKIGKSQIVMGRIFASRIGLSEATFFWPDFPCI